MEINNTAQIQYIYRTNYGAAKATPAPTPSSVGPEYYSMNDIWKRLNNFDR